jgi:hypothetical protein
MNIQKPLKNLAVPAVLAVKNAALKPFKKS